MTHRVWAEQSGKWAPLAHRSYNCRERLMGLRCAIVHCRTPPGMMQKLLYDHQDK